jgi:hypothetical protein
MIENKGGVLEQLQSPFRKLTEVEGDKLPLWFVCFSFCFRFTNFYF